MHIRDHIKISLLSTFLPVFFLIVILFPNNIPYELTCWGTIMAGIIIGSLMPDTDSEKMPRGVIHRVRALGLTCIIIFLLFLILLALVYLIGFTTGVVGVATIEYLWYAVGLVTGIMAGGILHLFEDSCTASGIQFFYPNGRRLTGTIRTDDKTERRPGLFAWVLLACYIVTYGLLTIPMYILHGEITLIPIVENTPIMFAASIIAVGISWVIIFIWAEVRVTTKQLM